MKMGSVAIWRAMKIFFPLLCSFKNISMVSLSLRKQSGIIANWTIARVRATMSRGAWNISSEGHTDACVAETEGEAKKASNYPVAFLRVEYKASGAKRTIGESSWTCFVARLTVEHNSLEQSVYIYKRA